MSDPTWNDIVGAQATLLSTRKRDGRWVATPVTAVVGGSGAFFLTATTTGKVKRLTNFSDVKVASCTFRGEITGPLYAATARQLHGEEYGRALRVIRGAHPIIFGVILRVRYWARRSEPAIYELSELRAIE